MNGGGSIGMTGFNFFDFPMGSAVRGCNLIKKTDNERSEGTDEG